MRAGTAVRPARTRVAGVAVALLAWLLAPPSPAAAQEGSAPTCAPGGAPVTGRVELAPADARTYQLQPVEVAAGTTRVEVRYDWGNASVLGDTPLTATTVDLGVWDADGYRSADGFRGWAGSRHREVVIAVDEATRTMYPGPIEPGTWHVEFGIGAVAPDGGWYAYEVTCLDPPTGPPPAYDPVDPGHVASSEPGWYHGDFHMHGFHSHPDAPPYDEFVAFARSQGLDFLPLTEYVTGVHWGQLGPIQRANPDVLVWPGREIITYFGHVTQFGATPDAIEYRHGFEDVTIAGIVDDAVDAGALLGVAHPTAFEQPGFSAFCRGCAWELEDAVAWERFTTFEVAQAAQVLRLDPSLPGLENPFTSTALAQWERLMDQGVFLTAVGASDDKLSGEATGPTATPHGVPATAVYAEQLSVAALRDAVRAGHAYVRTRGVAGSPEVELTAVAPDGTEAMMGDDLVADTAEVAVTVRGGAGQVLRIIRDGHLADLRVVTDDAYTHTFTARRDADPASPLGTRYRVETADLEGRTTITNPVFLVAPPTDPAPAAPAPTDPAPTDPAPTDPAPTDPAPSGPPTPTPPSSGSDRPAAAPVPTTPGTGGGAAAGLLLVLAAAATRPRPAPGCRRRWRSSRPAPRPCRRPAGRPPG